MRNKLTPKLWLEEFLSPTKNKLGGEGFVSPTKNKLWGEEFVFPTKNILGGGGKVVVPTKKQTLGEGGGEVCFSYEKTNSGGRGLFLLRKTNSGGKGGGRNKLTPKLWLE